jgi:hypothetical protein
VGLHCPGLFSRARLCALALTGAGRWARRVCRQGMTSLEAVVTCVLTGTCANVSCFMLRCGGVHSKVCCALPCCAGLYCAVLCVLCCAGIKEVGGATIVYRTRNLRDASSWRYDGLLCTGDGGTGAGLGSRVFHSRKCIRGLRNRHCWAHTLCWHRSICMGDGLLGSAQVSAVPLLCTSLHVHAAAWGAVVGRGARCRRQCIS